MEKYITFAVMLFLLSMICERIADFLKHFIDEQNGWAAKFVRKIFNIGNTTHKGPPDSLEEDRRYYRILKINITCGFVISFILHADFFQIIRHLDEPSKALTWDGFDLNDLEFWQDLPNSLGIAIAYLSGCTLTGLFISFGSKFWHDLLGILFQIKNYRRLLADPDTFKIDNVKSLDRIINTYQSDFIKAAFFEAKSKYMALENVKAISLMRDEEGYYFDITLKIPDPGIGRFYQYILTDGTPQNVRIKVFVMGQSDDIVAHAINLSSRIFDNTQPDNWGTLGCIVRPVDTTNLKRYILTCSHNVINPVSELDRNPGGIFNTVIGTDDPAILPIGKLFDARRDHEIDAALIEVSPAKLKEIINRIPGMGVPNKMRTLQSSDEGKERAFLFGAKSKSQEGIVISLYCDVEINYDGEKFQVNNLIAISNKDQAISQSGDSGSCVVDQNNNVLGLVVAGNSRITYIIPIETMLIKLKVTLVENQEKL